MGGEFKLTARHEANLEAKRKFVAAMMAQDWAALAEVAHPELELFEPPALPFGGVYKGIEEFKRCMAMIPQVSHKTERMTLVRSYYSDDPDYIVNELDFVGVRVDNGERIASIVMEKTGYKDGKVRSLALHWFSIPDFGKK